ncbi:MAG: transglutaminase family protein, partial [Anaerolineae bacterium]
VASDRQMFVEAGLDDFGKRLVTAVRSRFVLRQGDRYNVTSRVSFADRASLQAASTDYPQWVRERYLQLPDTITPETLALAEELTAPYDTVFDKAIAVRNYLRENIAYNDQINAPPEDAEPVHYTLFISQEAYCNYYASAMTVMLRSQGSPARIVSGYAQGEFVEDTGNYRVRASNAHTWVEVYFPEYGWIQFEPTAAIPTVDRDEAAGNPGDAFGNEPLSPDERLENLLEEGDFNPDGLLDQLPANEAETKQTPFQQFISELPVWQIVVGLVILAGAGGSIFAASAYNVRVESDVMRSYGRLGSWGRWLGVLFRPSQTPHERADLMTTAVPGGKTSIRSLTQQFVRQQFSPAHAPDDGFDSRSEWKELRPVLLRQAIVRQLRKLTRNQE